MAAFYPLLAATVLVAWVWTHYFRRTRGLPLPPGPPKRPLIGSALSIPRSQPWKAFAQWAKEYGSDIIHLEVFGTSMVVLNGLDVTIELLEKRSSSYSDRPRLVVAAELMGWVKMMFLQPYGAFWRTGRRLFHEQFQPAVAARFRPQQLDTAHRLLLRLLESPAQFREHIRRSVGVMSMDIAYGVGAGSERDAWIDIAARCLAAVVEAATPGSYLVDFLPALKWVPAWFPGGEFKRTARQVEEDTRKMINLPFEKVKWAMAMGNAPPSFTSHTLQSMGEDAWQENEEIIKWTAASIYVGAADTSVAVTQSFILAMLAHPRAMRTAQAELDAVLRPGYLPTFDDLDGDGDGATRLPYVTAVVLETLRFCLATPLAIPHRTAEEDVFRGMRIPAGSLVIPNVWAITHDEELYPESYAFKPERFLTPDRKKLNPDILDPRKLVFGFGRRICPGMHLGFSFVWIVVASILACYDITKAVDERGEEVEPTYGYTSGLLSFPEPFDCQIRPRSRATEEMVKGLRAAMET